MYQSNRTYIKADMKMAGLIMENPRLLLLLEHFNVDFTVGDKTIARLCDDYAIPERLFLVVANLYNGFTPRYDEKLSRTDIPAIISFLRNSHHYYKSDKYPEIISYVKSLLRHSENEEVRLIEQFFNDYFQEVVEHLDYEENVAFPYFARLIGKSPGTDGPGFSANDYREHHSDIETKLTDLKNLLLKHIRIDGNLPLRRRMLLGLLELEFDLYTHALIEEKILIPLIEEAEKQLANG